MSIISRRGVAAAAAGLIPAAALAQTQAQAQTGTESTIDRIQRTKVLRIAALPGELPYFQKDIVNGTWSGAAIDFASSIAKVFDAKLAYVESTYAGSVLDLESNKIDLAFALAATPQRAMAIAFTHPFFTHPYGCLARKGFDPKTWSDINKPSVKIAVDVGSLHEVAARHYAPHAQITAYPNRDAATLAFQSGRADVFILAAMLALATVARNPSLGPFHMLSGPTVALPSNFGIRREPDTRFRDVLNAWIDFNRGVGQIRLWLLDGLKLDGVKASDVPPDVTF